MKTLFTLHARLEHLAIVSWAVPAERLQAMLPEPLVPQPLEGAPGLGLLSMAMMLDTTMGETYPQVNERAYVMRPDGTGRGAFFWRSHARSWQAFLFRSLLGIPEHTAELDLDVSRGMFVCQLDGTTIARLDLERGVKAAPNAKVAQVRDAAKRLSENPLIGYTLNWGELCATPVTHDVIDARPVHVEHADASFMVPSVLISNAERHVPLTAVYQRRTPFHIGLPPRPIGGRGYVGIWTGMFAPWAGG